MKRPKRLTTETLPEVGVKVFTTASEQTNLLADANSYTDTSISGKMVIKERTKFSII